MRKRRRKTEMKKRFDGTDSLSRRRRAYLIPSGGYAFFQAFFAHQCDGAGAAQAFTRRSLAAF
jgi:hypothetical protein